MFNFKKLKELMTFICPIKYDTFVLTLIYVEKNVMINNSSIYSNRENISMINNITNIVYFNLTKI